MGLIAIACGLIVALGALGASIGIAMVGSKYLESSARQPELSGRLQNQCHQPEQASAQLPP